MIIDMQLWQYYMNVIILLRRICFRLIMNGPDVVSANETDAYEHL